MTAKGTGLNRPVPSTKYLNPDDIPKAIETLLPPDKVEKVAREAHFVERERKTHPYAFIDRKSVV